MVLRKSCIYYTTAREGNWFYAYCTAKQERERGKGTGGLCENCTVYERDQDYDWWEEHRRQREG